MSQCTGTTNRGTQCLANAQLGRPFCYLHDPRRAGEAAEARRRGAKTTNSQRAKVRTVSPDKCPAPPQTIEDCAAWLRWVVVSTATGVIDARTSAEISKALRELRPTLEKLHLEGRVKELEAALKEARGAR